jgi:putative copper resistance protein D
VGALLLTGGINACYLVGMPAALFGTHYGQLLLLKLALFALMLVLAAGNRLRLLRIAAADGGAADTRAVAAMRHIARNAGIEFVLGLAIALIVGALGIAIPGAHTEIVWPFPFTIDIDALDDEGLKLVAGELLLVGVAGAVIAGRAARRRRRKVVATSAAVSTAALVLCGYLVAVPAYPTTYAQSPLRFTSSSIAEGSALYASHCATCHGADGYGDGPAAASLSLRPANLTAAHALNHRPGEIYWWLTHGIAGTPMLGFADRLTPTQRWQVVSFLRARVTAEVARKLTGSVGAWRPIVAPDFTFEIGRGDQETLKEQRGRYTVLLVLYTLPASQPRLTALADARSSLARAGFRVIALPCAATASPVPESPGSDRAILAVGDASVVATYALFLHASASVQQNCTRGHGEFVIDRDGYLRALRTGLGEPAHDRIAELLVDADRLSREPPHPPASEAHLH